MIKPVNRLVVFCLALTLFLSGCAAKKQEAPKLPIHEADGVKQVSAVRNGQLSVYDGTTWQAPFWTGVNLGATTPGHSPGELSPRKVDYRRWFPQMKAMNAKALRVYTILPPDFYVALAEFNATQKEPLWLVQGIWSPEEELIGAQEQGNDAYDPHITDTFRKEISDAVKVIHGDAVLPPRPGHASGTYKTDVSRYVLGWLVGTEWHQNAVKVTNDAHPGMPPYKGTYMEAKAGASPFESWLARMLDHVAAEEMKYGWQRPLAFVNWPTTDVLSHPDEANRNEDLVSINPLMVQATDRFRGGYYTAYHIYPYFPDFMRYEPRHQTYKNVAGQPDPYAGYLHEIRTHHAGIPFIVAEFGVPSSRGMAHRAALDRNQGMHTEEEQGRLNADMVANMHHEGYDGAFVFAWHDEWHKFTWNTLELEQPSDRRALWRNRLTNEEHFGLIAAEAGHQALQIYLDGKTDDWANRPHKETRSYPDVDLTITHDEAHVYLLLRKKAGAWDFSQDTLYAGLATLGAGSRKADQAPGLTFTRPTEFLLRLGGESRSHLLVNSAYDQHTFTWGAKGQQFPVDPRWKDPKQGIYLPWKLLMNRALQLPATRRTIPFEEIELGVLRPGITDPESPRFNSLADWYAAGDVLEVRIPWMMLGFTDPSSLTVWQYPYSAGKIAPVTVEGLTVEPYLRRGPGGAMAPVEPLSYRWEPWDQPASFERPKKAYTIMQAAFGKYQSVKKSRP